MKDAMACTLHSADGYVLSLRVYEADSPRAAVMCVHGMEEHQDRYQDFARFLQGRGFTVVTADLRGHGKTAPLLSHIADRDGHLRLLEDEQAILTEIQKRWPRLPVILFGHSMGTLIARVFLMEHSASFQKVVLSGYPNPNPAASAGLGLAKGLSLLRGPGGHSKLVDDMVLGAFAKAVPDARSSLDWLSVNPENVKKYAEDPLCGVPFTLGSYQALFQLIRRMMKPGAARQVQAELPFLLISGAEDPCTGGEKGRQASLDLLRETGFRNLTVQTLPGMRHEILNETCREAVFEAIAAFLES